MSDYLQALAISHAGKDWAFLSNNVLKNVRINDKNNDVEVKHIVFTLPRSKMKSNPSVFGDWQVSEEGCQESIAYRATFLFFLDFVQRICTYNRKKKKDEPLVQDGATGDDAGTPKQYSDGEGVVVFFESVRDAVIPGKFVGDRIHVFVNRVVDYNLILRSLTQSAKKKSKKKLPMFESHLRNVRTSEEYILNIANVYMNDTMSSKHLYESKGLFQVHVPKTGTNEFDALVYVRPENMFSTSVSGFKIEGAVEIQNDKSNYHDGITHRYKFPDETVVVKRFWFDIEPEKLYHKYLPSYQIQWVDLPIIEMEKQTVSLKVKITVKECPAKCIVDDFLGDCRSVYELTEDKFCELKNVVKGRFVIFECVGGSSMVNIGDWITGEQKYSNILYYGHGDEALEYTERLKSKFQNQHAISAFDMVELETSYRMEFQSNRREVQEMMVENFRVQCVSGEADISNTGKCIARWLAHMRPEMYEKHGNFEFEVKDHSLSPFANTQFWFSQGLDTFMCVASAHPELIKLHYGRFDSYRQHGENQLHWNCIYTGESATSKSFVFEMMKILSIEGTVTEVTYQTTRADAIDGDQNDHITVFNEAPPGLFQSGKNNQNEEALAMMKEKLTSNRCRTKTFERDEETGERRNRIAVSSQIGVYMGATNDNPALAEEAVRTRFHWGEFERIFRKDKNISDYQNKAFHMEGKPELMKQYEKFLFYCKDQHMKVYYIWKFIFCKIIQDIDLDAADIVLKGISTHLKRKYTIQTPPRTVERYRILCRIMTITNALDIVFNYKGGKHNGKPFELEQLLDVEPLLYCTEEIAICAFHMVAVEIPQLSPAKSKTIRGIWTLFKRSPKYKKDQDGMGQNVTDYSYARFSGHKKQLCQKIQHAIPYSVGKPSLHNIESVLHNLCQLPFKGRSHTNLDDYMEMVPDFVSWDSYSVPTETEAWQEVVAVVSNHGSTDIHMDVFKDVRIGLNVNIIKEAVLSITHKKTLQRRVVTGVPERCEKTGTINQPQFMEIIDLKCTDRDPPVIRNANQETNGVKSLMNLRNEDLGVHHKMVMNMDTDTWGWSQRCITRLGMEQEEAIEYHTKFIDHTLSKGTPMTFPKDLLKQSTQETVTVHATDSISYDLDELVHRAKRRRVTVNLNQVNMNNN